MRQATISLMAQRETAASPLAEALARVGDRWTLLVVEALLAGPRRFNDLLAQIPGLAANILSERLKRLEAERDAALKVAYDRPPPGLKPLAVGLGIGVAVGGTAAAWAVDGKPGVKAIASIGSAALGSIILWLASR